ncbi:hypothetical protein DSUL_100209 [Desulfovibrionales bacterium]
MSLPLKKIARDDLDYKLAQQRAKFKKEVEEKKLYQQKNLHIPSTIKINKQPHFMLTQKNITF